MKLDTSALDHIGTVYEINDSMIEVGDLADRYYRLTLLRNATVGNLVVFDILVQDNGPLAANPFRADHRTWSWHRIDRPIPFPHEGTPAECFQRALEQLNRDLS